MNLHLLALIQVVFSQTETSDICLSREGSIQSLLEGLYEPIAIKELGTYEYKRVNTDTDDLYIWYHNQYWFLSPVNYTVASSADASNVLHTVPVYGYCRGALLDGAPSCEDCWQLYWEPTGVNVDDQNFEDCTFFMSGDESYCITIMNDYDGTLDYPDTLCLDAKAEDASDANEGEYEYHSIEELGLGLLELLGEYEKVALYPYYLHVNSVGYMWHDTVTNHWAIGITLNDPLLLCYDKNDIFTGCVIWDDVEKESKPIDNLISVNEECINQHAALSSAQMIEIIVAIVITVVIITVIVVICVRYEKKEEHTKIEQLEAAEMVQTGLTDKNVDTKGGKSGGTQETYDMSPLNADDEEDDHEDKEEDEEEQAGDEEDEDGDEEESEDDKADKDDDKHVSEDDKDENVDASADEDNDPDLDDDNADAEDLLTQ